MNSTKTMLIIMDGWGIGKKDDSNAIFIARTPFIDSLYNAYPNSTLTTHGEKVGLPKGQMGNSEVGHMNIGAGRIVFQELLRFNNAFKDNSINDQDKFKEFLKQAKATKGNIHLFGLVSDGGVHSHISHFKGLIKQCKEHGLPKIYIHAFTDGRDTDPKSGAGFIRDLQDFARKNNAEIVSVIGRYYAMDRDKRWERTKKAYDLLMHGKGEMVTDLISGIQGQYRNGITDEFLEPMVLAGSEFFIEENDVLFSVNFRTDRPRQLVEVLTQKDMLDFEMEKTKVHLFTMSNYDKRFKNVKVIFEKEDIKDTLGEVFSRKGKTQVRIAETEKYPHVTFFFNGGRESEFKGESRIMIPSPKVATYDLQPEMSAFEITDAICQKINKDEPDFICLNFANTDMVGHTGVFEAGIKAAETVDSCVKRIVELGLKKGYTFLITADHGNCDCMVNDDGSPNTAHTTNLVPLFYVSKNSKDISLKNGKLGDIAPTLLYLMGIEIPTAMTGDVLVSSKK